MTTSDWRGIVDVVGFRVGGGASEEELDIAAKALRSPLPRDLRALYSFSDGIYDLAGEWWVVWPLNDLVERNLSEGPEAWSLAGLLAFGDDGAGTPFCICAAVPFDVSAWYSLDGASRPLAPTLWGFWLGWTSGSITT